MSELFYSFFIFVFYIFYTFYIFAQEFFDFQISTLPNFRKSQKFGWPTQSRMQIHCTCHTKYRKSIKQLRHSHFLNPAVESIGWQTPSRMQMYCTCHTKYKKSMASLFHSHLSRRAANSSWERQAAPHHDSQWFLIRIHKFNTSSKEPRQDGQAAPPYDPKRFKRRRRHTTYKIGSWVSRLVGQQVSRLVDQQVSRFVGQQVSRWIGKQTIRLIGYQASRLIGEQVIRFVRQNINRLLMGWQVGRRLGQQVRMLQASMSGRSWVGKIKCKYVSGSDGQKVSRQVGRLIN